MSKIFEIADEYIDEEARLDPVEATFAGIDGYEDQLTDYSPAGEERRAELTRRFLDRIHAAQAEGERDELARSVMSDRLSVDLTAYENNDNLREMSVSFSNGQNLREIFEQMPYESTRDWENVAKRLERIPATLSGLQESLRLGVERDATVARRQALSCARQARIYAGVDVQGQTFFQNILASHPDANLNRKLEDKLTVAGGRAAIAFNEYSTFLVNEYAPRASDVDAVGEERYLRAAEHYLGMRIDAQETYQWGWEELARLEAEIKDVCAQIKPGASLDEIAKLLDDDHERWIHGEEALVEWLKGLLDRAITGLNGKVFDIPEPLRHIDVRIAAPGGRTFQYYFLPSEDFSRPGTYWYPTNGRTRFPLWSEISTAYHEGVPGHHLQLGILKLMTKELSRFQRNHWVSGHAEGWALYAERLMDELGFYERPEYKLDMLLSHYFRAARVVIDIGLHLGYQLPVGQLHGGETWTPEIAHEFLKAHCNKDDVFVAGEIVRYLGDPGQAIGYKVGERVFLEARATAKEKQGADFDLMKWHTHVLSLGSMGLDTFRSLA